jgi:hypothetical protein
MEKLKTLIIMIGASFMIWLGVGMVDAATGAGTIRDIAVLVSFLSTLSLWLVWGLDQLGDDDEQPAEKAKRSGGEDARLALLLHLLDDDERQALKERLLDDLGADGEALPLADLLAAQEQDSAARRSRET